MLQIFAVVDFQIDGLFFQHGEDHVVFVIRDLVEFFVQTDQILVSTSGRIVHKGENEEHQVL